MRESEVRKKIIDAASRLFFGPGYNATGINQLVEEANIAKRSLYKHFDSKTDILMAYLDTYETQWYVTVRPYLAAIDDPKKRVLGLFDFRIFYQKKYLYPGCPFVKINAELGFDQEKINLRVRTAKNTLKAFIMDLVKASGHRAVLTDQELTDLIFLLIEGSVSSAAIYKSATDLRKAREMVAKFL